jgi:prenyltransferase beta subunit
MFRRLMLAAALAAGVLAPASAAAQTQPLQAALDWLRTQQQADGGFSNGFVPGSDPGATADALLAITSAGQEAAAWTVGGNDPLEWLATAVQSGAVAGAGGLAKVALALQAAGLDVHSFGGMDLTQAILADQDPETGLFGGGTYDSALAIQALLAADTALPDGALQRLLATRLPDGAYAFNADQTPGAGDSNTTALVVLALMAAGEQDAAAPSLEYFRATQNDDGGWTYQKPSAFGEATDANSTALVMQALLAAGEDLAAWDDPASALLSLQQPSGAFAFNAATPGDNLLATVQAIPALVSPSGSASRSGSGSLPLLGFIGLGLVLAAVLAAAAWRRRSAG